MSTLEDRFDEQGWVVFDRDPLVSDWVGHAAKAAGQALRAPELAHLHQCEGTWFVGLDALDNDGAGRVGRSAPLAGRAVNFLTDINDGWPELHKAQVSGVFPGYPRPRDGETDAGFRYRLNRCAAHVDGVLGLGTPKRRFVREPHAFILGLPLTEADRGAAPLVVWDGSHKIMQSALRSAFERASGQDLETVDVTEVYTAARRRVFETCTKVVVHGAPGTAYVLHRLAVHGVAPWAEGARAAPEGRLIAYFRPPMPGGPGSWVAGT